MKKLILALFLIVLSATFSYSQIVSGTHGGILGTSVCTTSNDSVKESNETVAGATLFADGLSTWHAQSFTLDANTTVTQIDYYLTNAADTGTVTMALYTDSAGKPNTIISNTSVTLNSVDVATGPAFVAFVLATPVSLSGSTMYHIVMRAAGEPGGYNSRSNYSNTSVYADGTFSTSSDSGANWSNNTVDAGFRVYGCTN